MLFRRPWVVEAECSTDKTKNRAWLVKGWRNSRSVVEQVAQMLAAGTPSIQIDVPPEAKARPIV